MPDSLLSDMFTCPFHLLTNLNCPFCGAQRMIVELCHGRLLSAFWLNPGLAIGLPVVCLWWLWKHGISSQAALVFLSLTVLWGIIRNVIGW